MAFSTAPSLRKSSPRVESALCGVSTTCLRLRIGASGWQRLLRVDVQSDPSQMPGKRQSSAASSTSVPRPR